MSESLQAGFIYLEVILECDVNGWYEKFGGVVKMSLCGVWCRNGHYGRVLVMLKISI